MHSSSVKTRPATCVDGGAGAGTGAGAAGGAGAWAPAALVKTMETRKAIEVGAASIRGLDMGTKEYHAVWAALGAAHARRWTAGGCTVDTFFLDGP